MSEKRHEKAAELRGPPDGREDVVADAAARILAEADRAIEAISDQAARVPGDVRAAGEAARKRGSDAGTGDDCEDVRADQQQDHAKIGELDSEIEEVHAELGPIKSGLIGLQNHSLRMTGVAALVLAVLLAIAWQVIGG